MGTTTQELVIDLQAKPRSYYRDRLIALAQNGYYHDFQSRLAAPKVQLAVDLMKAGYVDLAERVKHGMYDETPTLEQLTRLRSDVGDQLCDLLSAGWT